MVLENKNIKLKQVNTDASLESAQISLTYKQQGSEEKARESSYEILSALKSDNDVIIELNSTLFNLPDKEKDSYFRKFVETIRSLDLEYRYRKVSVNTQSIFSFLFGQKTVQAHEILVYVPHEVWLTETFRSILPIYGARYYVTKEAAEADEILEEMYRMMDFDKLDFFKLIIFDAGTLSSMGINSSSLTIEDLKEMLGV